MDEILKGVLTAPIANLFVFGGLVFLVIAVIGGISGKIEPGEGGRKAAAILGAVFMVIGLVLHVVPMPTKSSEQPATAAKAATETSAPPSMATAVPPTKTAVSVKATAAPVIETPVSKPTVLTQPTAAPPTADAQGASSLPSGSWQPIQDLPRQINSLLADPASPQVLYAGTGDNGSGSGVYKSEDGGLTWRLSAKGLPSEDVEALACGQGVPLMLYASLGHQGEIYASTDGAESWTRLGQTGLTGGFYRYLSVSPVDAQSLFTVLIPGGVARSSDGGHTWLPVGPGLPADKGGRIYALSLAIDPTQADIVYVGTGGWVGHGNGVYKSVDGGETWTSANRGMMDYRITALTIDPVHPQTVYAGGDGGQLFKSTDGGGNWIDLSDRLKVGGSTSRIRNIHVIAIDSKAPETLYLLGDGGGPLTSNDGGEAWRMLGIPGEGGPTTFSAMAVIFQPDTVVVVGIKNGGGWRYAP